ncbi:hypothetical protein BGZ60DRAFT_519872 [Tricladium varicosporioides]|nr:hypothetical protein BGZ60DRAFT_519872 [Hymenoscyphus varicosporioides]
MASQYQQPGLEPVSNASTGYYSQLQVVEPPAHAAAAPTPAPHVYAAPTPVPYSPAPPYATPYSTPYPAPYSAQIPGEKPPVTAANVDPPPKKICGLRKTTFWLTFGLAILALVVIAGGVTAAVLVIKHKSNNVNSSASTTSGQANSASYSSPTATTNPTTSSTIKPNSASTPVSVSTVLQTVTAVSGSATATGPGANPTGTSSSATTSIGPGGVQISCPGTDNTNYVVPNTSQKFVRRCNTDLAGSDFSRSNANNMAECLALCAKQNEDPNAVTKCYAVTWVYRGPQGTSVNYCWLKNKLPGSSFADGMESAYLVT